MQTNKTLKNLASTQKSIAALRYANDLVRKLDSDSFLPSFFFPSELRPTYLAVKALNAELSSIDDAVTNPVVGKMRFQWWRDIVKDAFHIKPPTSHPLSHLLSTLPLSSLSAYHFTRLINTREQHFLNPTFSSLQDLADYSSGTQASILYLLLQGVDSPFSKSSVHSPLVSSTLPHSTPFVHTGGEHLEATRTELGKPLTPVTPLLIDHAASHLAVAITISIILRSIPYHASKKISLIPVEIASRHSLSEESLFRLGPAAPNLLECVSTLVGIAEAELRTARACFDNTSGVPPRVTPVFLAATPARSFLQRLSSEKIGYNVFDGRLHKKYWKLPFQIWGDFRLRKF